jgi:RNA polymerase sigma-70 factor (ECF subfamily)
MDGRAAPEYLELFQREYSRLVRCLRPVEPDAADAVQEAFVEAFLRWRRVGKLDDPAGWIRRVALNRLLNVRRSARRKAAAIERLPDPSAPGDAEEHLDLRAAVRDLPPQQRIAVALYYGGDLTVEEVADAGSRRPSCRRQ